MGEKLKRAPTRGATTKTKRFCRGESCVRPFLIISFPARKPSKTFVPHHLVSR